MGAIANDWLVPMGEEFKKPYYKKLYEKVRRSTRPGRFFRMPTIFLMPLNSRRFPR